MHNKFAVFTICASFYEVHTDLFVLANASKVLLVFPLLRVSILWSTDPLLRGDSVNNSRCYGAPAAYACAVTSHNNRRGDAGGVFFRSAPRLCDSIDRVLRWSECSAVEGSPVEC
jgi:hypothetical protein